MVSRVNKSQVTQKWNTTITSIWSAFSSSSASCTLKDISTERNRLCYLSTPPGLGNTVSVQIIEKQFLLVCWDSCTWKIDGWWKQKLELMWSLTNLNRGCPWHLSCGHSRCGAASPAAWRSARGCDPAGCCLCSPASGARWLQMSEFDVWVQLDQ